MNGYYPAFAQFNFYMENNKICVDGKGLVEGQCYCEDRTLDHPGCSDYDMDIESFEIEGFMSTVEKDFEDYEKISLYGQEAYDFLVENGWDEDELTWGLDLD